MNRILALTATTVYALSFVACNPFRSPIKQDPVTQVSTGDANVNSRWSGTVTTPADLAGAVQMRGAVSMTPANNSSTRVSIALSNATPGGVHPWQLRHGRCGSSGEVFGSSGAYRALKIDEQGKASSDATIALVMPAEGDYYVSVGASAANPETIVACGNLAPPSR